MHQGAELLGKQSVLVNCQIGWISPVLRLDSVWKFVPIDGEISIHCSRRDLDEFCVRRRRWNFVHLKALQFITFYGAKVNVGMEGGGGDRGDGSFTPSVSERSSDVQLVMSWCSPMAHQVAISLRHKGVRFRMIEESSVNRNLKTLHASPLYKRIPILVHMRKLVSESLIILEYVEDAWPKDDAQLLPSDPFERSAARYWSNHVQNKVILTLLKFAEGGPEHLNQNLQDTFVGLNNVLSVTSPTSCFFMGDELGMVDIVFASVLPWLQALQNLNLFKLPCSLKCPRLHRWIEALEQHSSVKTSLQICAPGRLEKLITQVLRKAPPAKSSV